MESWRFGNIGSILCCLYKDGFYSMLLKAEFTGEVGLLFLCGLPAATKSTCRERSIGVVSCGFLGDGSKDREMGL